MAYNYSGAGAGAGGASAAYYARKYASESSISAEITVFERSSHVGGRSTTVNVYSQPSEPVELGASIFVEVNRNLVSAAKEFGLRLRSEDDLEVEKNGNWLGVWNGEEFVYLESHKTPGWWTKAKVLWKYGLAPIWTQRLMKSTVATFLKMYEAPHFPFRSLSEVAHELGLTAMTSSTGEQVLQAYKIGRDFAREIIQASTRVNYAQNLKYIHGLETMVCMATDGAMAVEGGNWQIFDGMLKAAGADVRLNTSVTAIERQEKGGFVIRSKPHHGDDTSPDVSPDEEEEEEERFDAVILAAPLQFADIKISPPLPRTPDRIPYVSLHVTLFATPYRLSPTFFNMSTEADVPDFILTTLRPSDDAKDGKDGVGMPGFFSISRIRKVYNPNVLMPSSNEGGTDSGKQHRHGRPEYVYKIFSPHPISPTFLSSLLNLSTADASSNDDEPNDKPNDISPDDISWQHHHRWDSYPYLYPRVTFDDPDLLSSSPTGPPDSAGTDFGSGTGGGGGLWYTSGIEAFISTMETSSLMGMNVARLVVDDWLLALSALPVPAAAEGGRQGRGEGEDYAGDNGGETSVLVGEDVVREL